jgi:glucose-1-phosphate cytidylyltransferase
MAAKPTRSFHVAVLDEEDNVKTISSLNEMKSTWVNAGYFVFRKEIFDYIKPGEELVEEPFQRLISEKKLMAHPYEGVFLTMDTFKEKQALDDMYAKGDTPWKVWKTNGDQPRRSA